MAKLIIDRISYEIEDGSCLADVCQQAGVPFSCNTGVCGSCQITVTNGCDDLNELNQEEKDLGMDRIHRLACQCRIGQGVVEASFN